MTDRIALVFAALIALAVLADVVLNQSAALLFLGKKLVDLIDYVSIWR